MDKRGISPLMATILLIVLSVGMGVAVMSWGEEYIEAKAEFVQGVQEAAVGCDLVSFSIIKINNVPQICVDKTTIKGLIDNGADADIVDFHARVVGSKGIFVQESILDQTLPRASATPVAFSFGDLGPVRQVKFTPKILVGGEPVLCPRQAVVVDNVRPC